MKKLIIGFICASFVVYMTAYLIIGITSSVSNSSNKISTPELVSLGSFLYWEEVENAEEYNVYCNEELVATIESDKYTIDETDTDNNYCIIAKSGKKSQANQMWCWFPKRRASQMKKFWTCLHKAFMVARWRYLFVKL